jgi:hypothetical protein
LFGVVLDPCPRRSTKAHWETLPVPVPFGFGAQPPFLSDAQARALLLLCTQNKTVQVRGLASLQLLQTLTDSSGSLPPAGIARRA